MHGQKLKGEPSSRVVSDQVYVGVMFSSSSVRLDRSTRWNDSRVLFQTSPAGFDERKDVPSPP